MNCPECEGSAIMYTDIESGHTAVLCDACERMWHLV